MAGETVDQPLIPSSQSGLPATDVLPGSEVQKVTAIRRGTLPQAPTLTGLNLVTGLGAIANALQGFAAGVQGKDTTKITAQSQELMDRFIGRQALGYMAGLNAATLNDPTQSGDALKQLGTFITTNAAVLPADVQAVGQKVIQDLRDRAMKVNLGVAMNALANDPSAGERVNLFARMANYYSQLGVDPNTASQLALNIAKLQPEKLNQFTTHLDPNDPGSFYIVGQLPGPDGKPDAYKFYPDGTVVKMGQPLGPGQSPPVSMGKPMTGEELTKNIKFYADAAAEQGLTPSQMAGRLIRPTPEDMALHQKLLIRARELEVEQKGAEQRRPLSIDDRGAAEALNIKTKAGQTPKFDDELPEGAANRIEQYRYQRQFTEKSLLQAAENAAKPGQGWGYTPEGKPVVVGRGVTPEQFARGVHGGTIIPVTEARANTLQHMDAAVVTMGKLKQVAETVLAPLGDGQNLWKSIELPLVRATMGNENAVLLKNGLGPTILAVTRAAAQTGRMTNLEVEQIKKALEATDNMTIGAYRKLINWTLANIQLNKQAMLGATPSELEGAAAAGFYDAMGTSNPSRPLGPIQTKRGRIE